MTDIATLAPLVGILMMVGAFAGVLAGLLGVGGGIVLVPAFFWLFNGLGYASDDLMQVCVATSLATIVVTSMRSVAAHDRKGAVDWTVLRKWAPMIAIGAVIGVLVVHQLRSSTMQMIFAVIVLMIALYMMFGRSNWRIADRLPGGMFHAWFGPLMGFLSVLLGIGGGSIGTPMQTLHGIAIHRAVATSAGFGMAIALPSAIGFLFTPVAGAPPCTVGAVNVPSFLIVIATTTITAPIGAALAHKLDPKKLKRVFAGFAFLVALNMLREAFL